MMHIGIITSEFPPDIGGVETYAAEFSRALVDLGHHVTVFVHISHPVDKSIPGITIKPVLHYSRRLDRSILSKFDMDAWHVMNAAHSWLTLETDKPVVVSIHGNDFLKPYPLTGRPGFTESGLFWRFSRFIKPIDRWLGSRLTKRYISKALPKASAILANSRYTESVFLEKYPQCKRKTVVAQVGVGDAFLSAPFLKNENDIPHLLTVSRLSEPRKDINLVLEALSRMSGRYDFRYTVIGEGKLKTELRALAEKRGLKNKVFFLGRQPTEQVIKQMSQSNLFILTSSILPNSHEGFGIVYLEAAACGTPSLATRQAGAIEAIADNVSGYFVNEPTAPQIQSALEQFLSGTIQFDKDSCKNFAKEFTWSKVVKKALPFYTEPKAS